MFGTLSNWIKEWKKVEFINSTADLLKCFEKNNELFISGSNNCFVVFEPIAELWDEKYPTLPGKIKMTKANCFQIKQNTPGYVSIYSSKWKITLTGEIEADGVDILFVSTKTRAQSKIKKPKFSSTLEVINSSELTTRDDSFLRKKAKNWGISTISEMEEETISYNEVEEMEIESR
jgi:hypothetical protein